MTLCTHAEGHEFLDAVCIHCGIEDGLGRAPLFAGLRAIQEQHVPYVDKSGYKTCMRCGITWPCKTRQLADNSLGEKSNG